MMKALIVEDEKLAQARLSRLLRDLFPDIEIAAVTDSVRSTVEFLTSDPPINIIFMDVELADGECFEIFRKVPVHAQVVMTTAYDTYAIKAFEAGSIDYLLKPIDPQALVRAVSRCRERENKIDVEKLLAAVGRPKPRYKEHSVVQVGDRLIPVAADEIACFFSEDKANYLIRKTGERYLIDSTLDLLETQLDPDKFFRISRGCIIARSTVKTVHKHLNGRLMLDLVPSPPVETTVSRARVEDFLSWLG